LCGLKRLCPKVIDDPKFYVTITVKEVRGICPIYKQGDKIFAKDFYVVADKSANICIHAFIAMGTLLSAFIHGSSAIDLGIGKEENLGYLQCPDPGPPYTEGGTVIFEVKREKMEQ